MRLLSKFQFLAAKKENHAGINTAVHILMWKSCYFGFKQNKCKCAAEYLLQFLLKWKCQRGVQK